MKIHPNARDAYRVTLSVFAFEVRSWNSLSELAVLTGRDKSNLQKSLAAMAEQGLITEGTFDGEITQAGRDLLAALQADAEADIVTPAALDQVTAGPAAILHAQIVPDALNPRKAFDDESLDELAASIRDQGLMQNLVVRAGVIGEEGAPTYRLISGERRWRAIGRLIAEGAWPADRPIPVQIRDIDDAQHAALALIENLQRKDLKPLEEAQALQDLMATSDLTTADIAEKIGFTQRWVQQRLQLLKLPAAKQRELTEGKITVEDARRWLANQPRPADLPDPVWLMALEFFDYTERETDAAPALANRPTAPAEQAALQQLTTMYWARLVDDRKEGAKTGHMCVDALYSLEGQLTLKFGAQITNESAREDLLQNLQMAVTGQARKPGTYATTFLNGPFEIYQDILDHAAETAEEWRKQDEEREARQRDRQERVAAAQAKVQLLIERQAKLPTGASNSEVSQAAISINHPLPWAANERGGLFDANGKLIQQAWGEFEWIQSSFIAAAVNQAAGLTTPIQPVQTDEDGDDDLEDDEA